MAELKKGKLGAQRKEKLISVGRERMTGEKCALVRRERTRGGEGWYRWEMSSTSSMLIDIHCNCC